MHFASSEVLSDTITFRRGVDNSALPGTSRHTLSIFGVDGSIKFRDSRSVIARRSDRQGRVRGLDITVWAAVELVPKDFDVVRHEEIGSDWITLIKLRPGKRFFVTMSPISGPVSTNPNHIRHDMLRLWNRQGDIHRMRYLAIKVRNHRTYTPWALALHKQVLGPLVPPPAAGRPSDDIPLIEFSDDDEEDSAGAVPSGAGAPGNVPSTTPPPPPPALSLLDSDDLPAATNSPAAAPPADEQPPSGLPTDDPPSDNAPPAEPEQEASSDPFGGLWQHARTLGMSVRGKEKE